MPTKKTAKTAKPTKTAKTGKKTPPLPTTEIPYSDTEQTAARAIVAIANALTRIADAAEMNAAAQTNAMKMMTSMIDKFMAEASKGDKRGSSVVFPRFM